jgi:hypothetical protein
LEDAGYVKLLEKCTHPESRKRKRGIGGLTMCKKIILDATCGARTMRFAKAGKRHMR